MNTNLITFEDKVSISQNPSVPDKNKISSSDVNQIKTAINSGLLNLIYPVGCYFETSDDDFNPNTSWGGTWELETDGTVLVSKSSESGSAFNTTVGSIVGEEEHTLTVDELAEHVHKGLEFWNKAVTFDAGSGEGYNLQYGNSINPGYVAGLWTNESGGNQPHNNVQPSKIINRWHRTA